MPDTHLPRDRPRWCHNMPLVGMGRRLYIAGSAAGYTLWEHRRAPHAGKSGLGARSKPYLSTCYTSMVHGSEAKLGRANGLDLDSKAIDAVCGDGVHVIPCGVACRLYLTRSPGPRTRKQAMQEGMVAHRLVLPDSRPLRLQPIQLPLGFAFEIPLNVLLVLQRRRE